jgi:hypothetical protein
MTDTTTTPEPTASGVSFIAPSGGAGVGADAEGEAGTAMAERNAHQQEQALKKRERETANVRDILAKREAATNEDAAKRAEEVMGMVKDGLPPPGPGLPHISAAAVAATMDPNNPVLNPDVSRLGAQRGLPPGARVPKPVLPGDSVNTQFASRPVTEEHAKEGEEASKGLPEPIYPPAGTQPTIELSEEEQKEQDERGDRQRVTHRGDAPYAGDPAFPVAR